LNSLLEPTSTEQYGLSFLPPETTGIWGSNSRLTDSETDALTTELTFLGILENLKYPQPFFLGKHLVLSQPDWYVEPDQKCTLPLVKDGKIGKTYIYS